MRNLKTSFRASTIRFYYAWLFFQFFIFFLYPIVIVKHSLNVSAKPIFCYGHKNLLVAFVTNIFKFSYFECHSTHPFLPIL